MNITVMDLTKICEYPVSGGWVSIALTSAHSHFIPKHLPRSQKPFSAIGSALFPGGIDAENPILEVAWGRKEDNRAMPRRCKHTGWIACIQPSCTWALQGFEVSLLKDAFGRDC